MYEELIKTMLHHLAVSENKMGENEKGAEFQLVEVTEQVPLREETGHGIKQNFIVKDEEDNQLSLALIIELVEGDVYLTNGQNRVGNIFKIKNLILDQRTW